MNWLCTYDELVVRNEVVGERITFAQGCGGRSAIVWLNSNEVCWGFAGHASNHVSAAEVVGNGERIVGFGNFASADLWIKPVGKKQPSGNSNSASTIPRFKRLDAFSYRVSHSSQFFDIDKPLLRRRCMELRKLASLR